MSFRVILAVVLTFCLFNSLPFSRAQKANGGGGGEDSARAARKHIADSTRDARERVMDSLKTTRMHLADSAKEERQHLLDSSKTARAATLAEQQAERKHRADSIATVNKYKNSRHYKDSVANARAAKNALVKQQRETYLDSIKTSRKKVTDSITAFRKARTDSIKRVQKERADSLAAIRKYRESRHYRDSVSIVQHERIDSMREARKAIADSIADFRKHVRDSTTKYRKHIMDSTKLVRTHFMDSIKAVRKVHTDSLAKVKSEREKKEKALAKAKADKAKLLVDLKIKQKHEKWSNESMLKKKWSLKRKVVQNTFTRYNYYYNANRKMDEALANMQRTRKENYDSLIGLYPFDPDRDSSLLKSDMDTIIHKVSVGIQIHDPRTKWGDDLYLLLGEAYYYKGHYEEAAIAFRYIIAMDEERKKKEAKEHPKQVSSKEQPSIVEEDKKSMLDFLKHKAVHNESILWLARDYTQSGHVENTESVLSLLESDPKLPEDLKGRLALEKAFVFLHDRNWKDAAQQLDTAVNDPYTPNWLRMRSAYLEGQLKQSQGLYADAAKSFQNTLDLYPKIEMDFYARKYLAYNTLMAGSTPDEAMKPLKRVLNDTKYASYYDQVYFTLGQLAANAGNVADAEMYLRKSLNNPRGSKKQKAISFAELGNVYYNAGNYAAAKSAYDSSVHFASFAGKDTLVALAAKRGASLGGLVTAAATIHDQDSLLALSELSQQDQLKAVRARIKAMEKEREDSAYLAENAALDNMLAASDASGESSEDAGGGNSWYFTNPTLLQVGTSEFKRKWGNRPLADNWRRSAAITSDNNAVATAPAEPADTEKTNTQLDENGLPTEASLLAFIPNTAEQKTKVNNRIARGYIDLANAYVKDLSEYPPATKALDTLDKRFPTHDYKAEDLYLRYIVALRQQKLDLAQQYSRQLTDNYPTSEFARLVKPKEDGSNISAGNATSESAYYDQTYDLVMQRQYTDALIRIREGRKQYKDPKYTKRFNILEAMALAGTGDYGKADTVISNFLHVYPSDSLTPWADAVMRYVAKFRPSPASTFKPGIGPDTDHKGGKSGAPDAYVYKPDEEHYVIVSVPGIESRTMGVKAALGDFNTFKFSGKGLSVVMDILSPQQGTIVVKKFANAADATTYMKELVATTQIFREYKNNEYQVFIISNANYLKMLNDRAIQPYMAFYKANYK